MCPKGCPRGAQPSAQGVPSKVLYWPACGDSLEPGLIENKLSLGGVSIWHSLDTHDMAWQQCGGLMSWLATLVHMSDEGGAQATDQPAALCACPWLTFPALLHLSIQYSAWKHSQWHSFRLDSVWIAGILDFAQVCHGCAPHRCKCVGRWWPWSK